MILFIFCYFDYFLFKDRAFSSAQQVYSMKTGVRGWNDYELPLLNQQGEQVDIDLADGELNPPVRPDQFEPKT